MVSRIAPTAMIKYMLRQWFVFSAKMFRLTSFLFGGEHPEEHSDDEDEEERKENVSDSVEEKRSDTDQQPLRRRRRREFRFMRVPKNDHIEIIPKEKVLIRMTDDQPVFGRAKETPEEVEARWMKLYVPAWFWTRVLLLMVWHWFCQLLITSNLIGLPRKRAVGWGQVSSSCFMPLTFSSP